jgi:site-specific DNA-methyltransferase (adenine-specific)
LTLCDIAPSRLDCVDADKYLMNVAQRGDALDLLRSLSPECATLAFFDPQHRSVLDRLKFGNEGSRQRGRAQLPAMSENYIDACLRQIVRALRPHGYCMLWADTFGVCEAHHRRVADALKAVDLIAWDSLRIGMGKRSRRRGDYLLVLQKRPIVAKTWTDHGIPSRWSDPDESKETDAVGVPRLWPEKVDRKVHPHAKPIGLMTRLIAAVTKPGELVVDPAAGSLIGDRFTDLRLACVFLCGRDCLRTPAPPSFARAPVRNSSLARPTGSILTLGTHAPLQRNGRVRPLCDIPGRVGKACLAPMSGRYSQRHAIRERYQRYCGSLIILPRRES